MAKKGKTYHRTYGDRSQYRQILVVLSDPFKSGWKEACKHRDGYTVKVLIYNLDFMGLTINSTDDFCDFPDRKSEDENEKITPIDEMNGKNLGEFLKAIFEKEIIKR